MKVFISHNKADKANARLIAQLLVGQGADVWFDEWDLRPGDSITGGIEDGIEGATVFVLLWSVSARQSAWVGAEYRAFIQRKIRDDGLRVVPVGLDDAPFPVLVADYRGFVLSPDTSLEDVVGQIVGTQGDVEVARLLQAKLNHMMKESSGGDPFPYIVCPACTGSSLKRSIASDDRMTVMMIECEDCGWGDWTE
mgnify:CR=1 FL=1